MSWVEFLLFVHVLAAVVWVGGGIAMHIIGRRILKRNDPDEIVAWSKEVNLIGFAIYFPTSLILLIAGFLLVGEAPEYELSDTFVSLGLAGFAFSFLVGVAYYGPQDKRLQRLVAEKGESDPGVIANVRQAMFVNSIEILVLVLVIADMSVKPGWP